jgi:hypothetical protein
MYSFAAFAFFARKFIGGKPERVVILAPALSGSSSRVIGAHASNSQRHLAVIWLPERRQAKTICRQRQAPTFDAVRRQAKGPAKKLVSPKLNVAISR